jgi:hypothetical protein
MTSSLIKNLQTSARRGVPLDTATLKQLGISSALAHEYVESGWLERLGRGVFQFAGDHLDRDATIAFLASKTPGLHIASKTALAWHGYRQNIAHEQPLILWGARKDPLPDWFLERFPARYRSGRLFDSEIPIDFGLSPLPQTPSGPLVSSPERALVELLSEVGVSQEVAEAKAIMESMRQLRSGVLGVLLAGCRMIKATRLCVLWAEEFNLSWAAAAREAAAGRMGRNRWTKRLKDGTTLTLKLE